MPWQVPITIDGLEYPVTFNTEAEPTQDDLNEAVQSILQQRNQAVPQPTGETPGYLSQLGTALDIGYRQMASGVGATFNALTGDTADVASEMVEQAKLQREQQAAQTPEDVQFMQNLGEAEKAYEEASGPFETIGALAQYPAAVMSQPGAAFKTAVQSAPNVLVSGATQLAGRAIGGVLGGVAGIETGPGAILTGLAGYVAGGALSNTLMEAGPAIYDVLYERTQGAASNMTADQIAAYLKENPDVIDEGLKTGAVRGTVIGAVESIGMKGAGRLLTMPERAAARAVQKKLVDAGVDIASKAAVDKALLDPALRTAARTAADAAKSQFSSAGNLARLAGASAIETGASGVGELAAQAAAGQEVSTKEAFLEMLGEVALSAPMAAATKTIEGAKYILNPALQNPDTQESAKAANVVIDASASQMAADIEANRPSLVQAELDRIEKDRAERQAQDEASFQAIRKRREAQALQQLGIPAEQPAPAPTPITPATEPEPEPLAELPPPSPLTGQPTALPVGTATPTTLPEDAIQEQITDAGVLRQEGPEMELQGVGEGNVQPEEVAGEGEVEAQEEVAAQPPAAEVKEMAAPVERDATKPEQMTPEEQTNEDFIQSSIQTEGAERESTEDGIPATTPSRGTTKIEQRDPSEVTAEEYENLLGATKTFKQWKIENPRPERTAEWGDWLNTAKEYIWFRAFYERDIPKDWASASKDIQAWILSNGYTLQGDSFVLRTSLKNRYATPHALGKITEKRLSYYQGIASDERNNAYDLARSRTDSKLSRAVNRAVWEESLPVSAAAVNTYGITLPEGYVKQGDLYVFQPTAAEKPTPDSVAVEPEAPAAQPPAAEQTRAKINLGSLLGAINAMPEGSESRVVPGAETPVTDAKSGYLPNPNWTRKPGFKARAQALFNKYFPQVAIVEAAPGQSFGGSVVMGFTPKDGFGYRIFLHELGHALSDLNPDLFKTRAVRAELDAISQDDFYIKNVLIGRGNKYTLSPGEVIAEFNAARFAFPELNERFPELAAALNAAVSKTPSLNKLSSREAELLSAKVAKAQETGLERLGKSTGGGSAYARQWRRIVDASQSTDEDFIRQVMDEAKQPFVDPDTGELTPWSRFNFGGYSVARQIAEGSIDANLVAQLNKSAPAATEVTTPEAEAQQKKDEKEAKKLENESRASLARLIAGERGNPVFGNVTMDDGIEALRQLDEAGDLPNIFFTEITTTQEFFSKPENEQNFPDTWAALSAGGKAEGMEEKGTAFVFIDNVGVTNLDRKLATQFGTTPEVAAVRRVAVHESIHKAISFLNESEQIALFRYLRELYSPEQLDVLAETYTNFANWRESKSSYLNLIEESLTRTIDSMESLPKDGILGEFIQWLKGIWRKITGKKGEPTLNDIKDVMRLIRNGLRNSTKARADRTISGGVVRYSYAGEKAIENLPEERRQFMRDSLDAAKAMAAAGKSSEEIRAATGWFPGKYDGKMRWEVPDEGAKLKNINAATLGGLLEHPSLFETYPSLADVEVYAGPQNSYSQADDSISLRDFNVSTVLHEVQHAIQKREGFAKGGDSRMAFADPRMGLGSKKGLAAANRILQDVLTKMGRPLSIEAFAKQAWQSDVITDEIKQSYADYVATTKRAASDPGNIRIAQETASKEWYRRLAGEIEARDVQARKDLTPEQRAATAPYSSENIAPEDAIVMFGGGGAQMSMATPEVDAEYLAAVEAGDSGNDNLNQLLRDASPDERQAVVDSWIKRNPKAAARMQRMVDEAAKMFVLQRAKILNRKYGMPVGLRYGELPENNISTGVRPSGRLAQEKGLSVYGVVGRKGVQLTREANALGDTRLSVLDRPAFLVVGKESGYRGGNAEPLFTDIVHSEEIDSTSAAPLAQEMKGPPSIGRFRFPTAVALDKSGNIIPPPQRFQTTSPDIRFSTPAPVSTSDQQAPATDAEYLAAVEAGDMEKAQRMVDEAAKAAGKVAVIASFPKDATPSPRKTGDWVSLDNKDGQDYQEEYAGPNWRDRSIRQFVSNQAWDDMQTGWRNGQTLVLKEDAVSADPVTRDDQGRIIPLSQRFQTTSPDIRFSLPTLVSESASAFSSGQQAARTISFTPRQLDVYMAVLGAFSTLRRKGRQSATMQELFDAANTLVSGITPNEFSETLQGLYNDNAALLNPGDSNFQVFNRDGELAGAVVLVAKDTSRASLISPEEVKGITDKLTSDMDKAVTEGEQSPFEGLSFTGNVPKMHARVNFRNVEKAAEDFVNQMIRSRKEKGRTYIEALIDIADMVATDNFAKEYIGGAGMESQGLVLQAIPPPLNNKIYAAQMTNISEADRVRLEDAYRKVSLYYEGIGTVGGTLQGYRAWTATRGKYGWLLDSWKADALKTAEYAVNAQMGGSVSVKINQDLNDAVTGVGKAVADEVSGIVEEDQDAIDLAAGEATLDEENKSLWNRVKDWLREIGAAMNHIKSMGGSSRASLTAAQRSDISKMSREEALAFIEDRQKKINKALKTLLGEESDAKTPEQQATREKRKKMVDTAQKRVDKGKDIDVAKDEEPESSEEQVSKAERTAQAILKDLSERYADPMLLSEKESKINEMRELYKQRVRQGVGPEQMTEAYFVNKAKELGADETTAGILWKAAELEIDARETMRQDKILQRRAAIGERADAQAHRIIFATERLKRQSGFSGIDTNPKKDTIIQAFRDQVKNPVSIENFITRLQGLNVSKDVANRLFKAAEREKIDLEAMAQWRANERLISKRLDAEVSDIVAEQADNPVSIEEFAKKLSRFNLTPKQVKRYFDIAARAAVRRVEINNEKAKRIIYERGDIRPDVAEKDVDGDTVIEAFRDQVNSPTEEQAFLERLSKLRVAENVAKDLFNTAARERRDRQRTRVFDMIEGKNAIQKMLREIALARRGIEMPLRNPIPWTELLSKPAKSVDEYRQRVLDGILANPDMESVDNDVKERIADMFTDLWQEQVDKAVNRVIDNYTLQLDRAQRRQAGEALNKSRSKVIQHLNLGVLSNDAFIRILGEKFGIKMEMTKEERKHIESLLATLQNESLPKNKRNQASDYLASALMQYTKVGWSARLSLFWAMSVLAGWNTMLAIGMSFMNGANIILVRTPIGILSKMVQGDFKGALDVTFDSLNDMKRYLEAFPEAVDRAWGYITSGKVDLLEAEAAAPDRLFKSWDSLAKYRKVADQMVQDPKMLVRWMGTFMRMIGRIMTALDGFNTIVTKRGHLSMAVRLVAPDKEAFDRIIAKGSIEHYRQMLLASDPYFANMTPEKRRLLNSTAEAMMYQAMNEEGAKLENADFYASESAFTMDPSGLGGMIYGAIKKAEETSKSFAERNLAEKRLEAQGADRLSLENAKLAAAYITHFLAYNAVNYVGLRFARFAANKFNQGLSFIPFLGMTRFWEKSNSKLVDRQEAFTEMIYRNQTVGAVFAILGAMLIRALSEEPDDEKRGWFINGGLENVPTAQRRQLQEGGKLQYRLGVKINGRWLVFSYQNWPWSQLFSALGSTSDMIRFSPEKWREKGTSDILLSVAASGLTSTLDLPALQGLGTVLGRSISSSDPAEDFWTNIGAASANWVGGFIPKPLMDLDYILDSNRRKYTTIWEKTAGVVPFYRRYVGEDYYNILGDPIKRNALPGSREFLLGPTEPAYKILGALNSRDIWLTPANAEQRMVGKGRNRRRLTQQEADAYSLETGKAYKTMILRYGPRALKMSPERARAFLSDKADEVRDRVLMKVYRGYRSRPSAP